ncbi:molybdenum cofactor biosynthesis protein F [Nocardia sp. SYP-A9097]|uniref:MoaF C-terminal domain-containing protein n=1 Tax=Nocardia sp. SYP-A9097 TaxID=2663237 RepID=UPI00129B7DD6|nr:MoaF C-terminal domain-containing protein [Nocardia sp. SYP-A9097]MRH88452.1 molybdenum cofactor biosynthesis protein F [Nocardia sp. SYP-A9097]
MPNPQITSPAFISVGDLGDGFAADNNTLTWSRELPGRRMRLEFDNDVLEVAIMGDGILEWAGPNSRGTAAFRETSIRPGIFLVDYTIEGAAKESVTLVLDIGQNLVTRVVGTLPTSEDAETSAYTRAREGLPLTAVETEITHGRIASDGSAVSALHAATDELIGKRVLYTYSPTELYEHIYLNPHFYTWHCIDGVEKGLADTDRCHYFKIAENLFLFVWREKIVPTLGVVLVDLDRMKTDGKIFGYKGFTFDEISNFPIGAYAEIRGVTPALA